MNFTDTDCTEKRARFDYCRVGMQVSDHLKGEVVAQVGWQVDDQIKEIQRKLQQEIRR